MTRTRRECKLKNVKFNNLATNKVWRCLTEDVVSDIRNFELLPFFAVYCNIIREKTFRNAEIELRHNTELISRNFYGSGKLLKLKFTEETKIIIKDKIKRMPKLCNECIFHSGYLITGKCKESFIKDEINAKNIQKV